MNDKLPPEVESALQAALNAHCICGQNFNCMSADAYEKGPLADAHKADDAVRLAIAKAIRDAEAVAIQRCVAECDDEASFGPMKGGNSQSGAERCAKRCLILLPIPKEEP